MDSTDPPGMPSAPGFKQVEGFGAAHFADGDAVGAQAQRGTDQIGKRRHAIFRPHGDKVRRGALQFACVLNDDDAICGLRHLGQQRIGQCGLAGRGAARDKDIGPGGDIQAQHLGLKAGHDSGCHIVVEREDGDGRLADGKGWSSDHRRQQSFEPFAGLGQFGRDTRATRMNLDADMMGDQPDDPLTIGDGQSLPRIGQTFGEPVHPDAAIRVQHHLDHAGIFQKPRNGRPERGAQHSRAAGKRFGFVMCCGHGVPVHDGARKDGPRIGVD